MIIIPAEEVDVTMKVNGIGFLVTKDNKQYEIINQCINIAAYECKG